MFKAKCKCINCKHMEDGIYFQRNECYKRIEMEIAQAIDLASDTGETETEKWLKETYSRIHIFEKYYNKR